ncbi:B-cell receptor CD22-like [Astyanax mexicanus]|uniref:B-cell receptor CD22-like n=1 Tax=Astyanax mexicanus TaxID=7994 RepID=UPI0020CB54AC|nr:B-cell receptor CD22-like [Astyanax mexicanus]
MFSRTSGNVTAAVILILLAGVQAESSVTFSSQSICAVTESTVEISCTFTTPDSSSVREREWYLNSDDVERVLKKDPEFSERVSVNSEQNNCDLTVWYVRVSDSGVYNFRFKTSSSDWISASPGVNLTVTDLQVKVDPNTVGQNKVKLSCSSTCSLGTNLYYVWYRNGEYTKRKDDSSILLDSTSPSDQGSYSCKVSGSWYRSPPVCVSADSDQKSCWGVAYNRKAICSLIGSSAYIDCYYTFPDNQKIIKTVWFIKDQSAAELEDLRADEEYQRRVQNRQNSQNDCSMIIYNLRESDAQTYRFRFYTDGGDHTGDSGVTLTVTGLKITVSDTDSGGKKLICSSTCTLTDHYTYIWYRNGQPVSDQSKIEFYLKDSTVDAGNYSCAVRGYEKLCSPAVYPPRNTRAELVSSGEIVEGDSVTLSCSSDANPPFLSYSWFNQREPAETPLTTEQNYIITSISSQNSGFYYCTAHNQLGHHSSTPIHLNVLPEPDRASRKAVGILRRPEFMHWHASTPVYETVSDLATTSTLTTTAASDDQEGVQYSSVQFKRSHAEEAALYSTVQHGNAPKQEDEVVYSTVKSVKP